MRKEEIISKGLYVHPQLAELISVKEYIVTRFNDKKTLLLRLSNDRADIATAVSLRVRQYNVRGEFISAESISVDNINVAPFSVFTPKLPIVLSEDCVEFRIDIQNASYGDYVYDVIDGEAHIRYEQKIISESKATNSSPIALELGDSKQRVAVKTLKAPVLLTVICAIILFALMCTSLVQLIRFISVETQFTLNDFQYEFMTDNKDNGPIRIVKYNGDALNLVIPTDIEGYEIGSIASGAFSDVPIRSIVIQGNTVLETGAFMDYDKLTSVEIPNVESIGDYVFSECSNLTTITLSDNLKTVGEYAFSGCSQLEGVSLPEGLESIGKGAFKNCTSFSTLVIPDSTQFIGLGIFDGCSLQSLTVPYIGSSLEENNTLGYLFDDDFYWNSYVSLSTIKITLQDHVPNETFKNCSSLRSIEFSKAVTTIGDSAFEGCSSLRSFKLSKDVTRIGKNAFKNCSSINEITVPDGITIIEEGTFYGCAALSEINIPESVRKINKDAYSSCYSITTLTVPHSVEEIGRNAFANCSSLVEVTIPFVGYTPDDPSVVYDIFGDNGANSIQVLRLSNSKIIADNAFENMYSLKEIYLNDKITSIGTNAFANCSSLNKINLHDGIENIGERAFFGCSSLVSIDIPDGIATIGASMFEGCASLVEIAIPESTVEIMNNVFKDCFSMTEIILPETVTSIGEGAFSNCTSLRSMNIPTGIKTLNSYTFENCSDLSIVAIPSTVTSIGDHAFINCTALSGIMLPENLEQIGKESFAGCTNLKTISIPGTVRTLGAGVLSGCTSLETLSTGIMGSVKGENGESGCIGYLFDSENAMNTSVPLSLKTVTLVSVETISDGAFANCVNISSINLPVSLTAINDNAFNGCSSINRIIIPDGVRVIGASSFQYCTSLETVSFPKHLTTINDYAFSGCTSLSGATLHTDLTYVGEGSFEGCSTLTEISIPDSVNYIGSSALNGCYNLETLSVPFIGSSREGTENIHYIFGYSTPESLATLSITDALTVNNDALRGLYSVKEINLNDGIYSIGSYALAGCSSLESLIIPSGVTYIGYGVLCDCTLLSELTMPLVGDEYDIVNLHRLFEGYTPSSLKKVVISRADVIPENCFSGCANIEEIEINCNATSIEGQAFASCTSLRKISIPDTVKTIGDYAFSYCINLRSFTVPLDLEYIGVQAFNDCHRLYEIYNNSETVNIYAGSDAYGKIAYNAINVYSSEDERCVAFSEGMTFIKNIENDKWYIVDYTLDNGNCVFPAGFSFENQIIEEYYISSNLFREDANLTGIDMPSAVYGMGEYAFFICSSLQDVNIKQASIINIPFYAFANCESLILIDLPEITTDISDYAFQNCTQLESVNLPTTLKNIGNYAFQFCNSLKSVSLYEDLESIGTDAFWQCTSLLEIYNLSSLDIVPDAYEHGYVSYYAYIVHNSLNAEPLHDVKIGELNFKKSDNTWFIAGHESQSGVIELLSFVYENKTIDSYIIPKNAFANSPQITSLVISDAVKVIRNDAFLGQYSLESVDFTNNTALTESDIYWLSNMNSLKSIVFPITLTEIPTYLISCFYSPVSISFKGNANITTIPSESFDYIESLETVVLPDNTVEIGSYAFYGCKKLNNIVLPDTLEFIKPYAFYGCTSLKTFRVPEGVTQIDDSAFANCTSLENVYIPYSLYQIGNKAFSGCSSLVSVDLKNCSVIGSEAFYKCSNLTEVVFPSTLTEIKSSAFLNCTSLQNVDLSRSYNLRSISSQAFYACNSLANLWLPEGLETIYSYAFAGCTSLAPIVIPSTVISIEDDAFYNCQGLYEIWNLSAINITAGSYGNGAVAYYAIVVHNSADEAPLEFYEETRDGVTFGFVKDYNTSLTYLVSVTNYHGGDVLMLPYIDGGYTLSRLASKNISLNSLFVPYAVSGIDTEFFASFNSTDVYYVGTESEWYDNFSNLSTTYIDLYTYVECKHTYSENTWMYNPDGSITTDISNVEEVTVEKSTCISKGTVDVVCSGCGSVLNTYESELAPHKFNGSEFCINCGAEISYEEFILSFMTFDPQYTFELNQNGEFVSNNLNKNKTSAIMVFTADEKMSITVIYSVSSEAKYDKFSITHNAQKIDEISGLVTRKEITINLEKGDTVTFKYYKDISGASNDDNASVHSISIEYLE